MRRRLFFLVVVLIAGAIAALPGCKKQDKEEGAPEKEAAAKETPETKTVWTCGMPGHPRFDEASKPADGRCPECGMKLVEKEVPVTEED